MSLFTGDNMNQLNRKCPICNSGTAKRMCSISYILPKGNPLPREYDVVCCAECGFAYANVNANQDVYNDYYANYNMYAEDAQLKNYINIRGEGRRSQDKQLMIDLIQEVIPHEASVLDVGCGSGEMLDALKEEGYHNICGMDPSAASIDRVHQKGIDGFVGNIFDDGLPAYVAKYDLVISTAVVEHIYDLHGYLRHIGKYLKSDKSYIMLNAPAIEKINDYIWPLANHFNHEHINYFSKISLNNLLKTEGFITHTETIYFEENNEKGIIGLYVKTDMPETTDLEYDNTSQEAIKNYLLHYEGIDVKDTIDSLLETKKSIVIWGVGSFTLQLLGNAPKLLEHVKYFVDNNSTKHGEMIGDKEIYEPGKLSGESDVIILICSIKNTNEIRKQITSMGWDQGNRIISFEN